MLTILIPTKNRPEFLNRIVSFYEKFPNKYQFIVGDASTAFNEVKTSLNLRHVHLPGLSVAETINKLNGMVTTKYATLLPDDDFLMPSGIDKCIYFLENNPFYTSCHGDGAMFELESHKIRDLGDYPLRPCHEEGAYHRFQCLFANYTVLLFGIHRIGVWKQMWAHSGGVKEVCFADEYIPNAISAIKGPAYHIDALYLIRQNHNRRISHVISKEWKDGFREFERVTRKLLTQESGQMSLFNRDLDYELLMDDLLKRSTAKVKEKKPVPFGKCLNRIKIAYLNKRRKWSLPRLRRENNLELIALEGTL